ncbi:MAG: rhamnulose-1-phosphate aldolase [bacterium]
MAENIEILKFRRLAQLLAERGWAEANAGNYSVKIDNSDDFELYAEPKNYPLPKPYPALSGKRFLVTATGSRSRDIPHDPASGVGLAEIVDKGNSYRILWGTGPLTSEFPAHLAIHAMCLSDRPEIGAIIHTHPPHLIALSHLADMHESDKLNEILKSMHPEVPILVPRGIGFIPFLIPGSIDLGEATCDALRNRNVVLWSMHGIVSIGENIDRALDQIEILEKAARIYLLAISSGRNLIGLTDNEISDCRKFWKIEGCDE